MPELTLDAAKEVVAQAIKHEAWSWDDPNAVTDDLVMATASNLVEVCTQASKGGSVADAVMEILFAAKVEPLSEPSKEAYTRRFGEQAATNGNAQTTPAAAAEPQKMAATSDGVRAYDSDGNAVVVSKDDPAPASESAASVDISSIFPGYDDLKVADIKKAITDSAASGDLSPEEWEQIKAYEASHEERKTVLSLEPEFKAPEPEPSAPSAGSFSLSDGVNTSTFSGNATAAEIRGDGGNVAAFYAGNAQSRAQHENLPLPARVDTSQHPPMLPIDITTVSDQELSRVATQYHSCFAYAQWLQSQEEGRERAAEHLEREAERDAYVQAYERHKSAIPEEKQTQPTALEAARKTAEHDAEAAPPVRDYRSRKVRHAIDARELKALASGYDKAVWRINEELERRARLSTSRPS